jgi:hypothetical protein
MMLSSNPTPQAILAAAAAQAAPAAALAYCMAWSLIRAS